MSHRLVAHALGLATVVLLAAGCVEDATDSDDALDVELAAGMAALSLEYDATVENMALLGLTEDALEAHVPRYGTGEVQLYGEPTARAFSLAGLPDTLAGVGRVLDGVGNGESADELDSVARSLVALGRTEQADALVDLPQVRFGYAALGVRVAQLACLWAIDAELDRREALYPLRCELALGLGTLWDGYLALDRLVAREQEILKQLFAALDAHLAVVDGVVQLAARRGAAAPVYAQTLAEQAAVLADERSARTTVGKSFGTVARNGVATGAGAAAGAAAFIVPVTSPGAIDAAALQSLGASVDELERVQAELDESLSGLAALGTMPPSMLTGLEDAEEAAVAAIDADDTSGGTSPLMQAKLAMQDSRTSFNTQLHELYGAMQNEARQWTMISNIMKTKHDTVKNSIGNIR